MCPSFGLVVRRTRREHWMLDARKGALRGIASMHLEQQ
jgi:hypothetical protein